MGHKESKSEIKRPIRRHTPPRRHARIELGDTRSESVGEWLFNHRVGLLVVFAVFVLSGTVLATARYNLERVDIEYFIEIIPEDIKQEELTETQTAPTAEELFQRMENVRNIASNDAATHQSSGSSSAEDDIEKYLAELNGGADTQTTTIADGANANDGNGGTGGGNDTGDSKINDDNKGKYQGNCTVNYRFENPVRSDRGLYIPAYTAKGGGVVVLDVSLDRNGSVVSARVSSSTNGSLNQVAIQAAKHPRTRFNIDSSAPSPHKGTITYTFIAQ